MIDHSYSVLAGASIAVLATAIFVIRYAGLALAKHHGSDVRLVWYFFALATTTTLLIAIWARRSGAIDATGSFHGTAGKVLEVALVMMLDLKGEIELLAGAFVLVLVPQLFSYVFAGLLGCAADPILVSATFRTIFWFILKSMVVASGVVVATASYGGLDGWAGMGLKHSIEMSLAALVLLTAAFAMLYLYRDLEGALKPLKAGNFSRLRGWLRAISEWAGRHIEHPPLLVPIHATADSEQPPEAEAPAPVAPASKLG